MKLNTLVANKIERYFKEQRFDKKHHLGLGDIRLTIGQQDEIVKMANGVDENRIMTDKQKKNSKKPSAGLSDLLCCPFCGKPMPEL